MKTISELVSKHKPVETASIGAPEWALLDLMGKEGASVLVKIDGERDRNRYTVVLSGGRFGKELSFRKDGDDVTQLILEAANDYFGDA